MENFFTRCKKDFFPEKENMTPIDIIDNSLLQCYDISVNKMAFDIFSEKGLQKYGDMIRLAAEDAYVLINQTADIIENKKHIEKNASDVHE